MKHKLKKLGLHLLYPHPLLILLFALLMIPSESPSFLAIAKAFDLPGIPIIRRYVGFKVFMSNSQDAFVTFFASSAYALSSA